MPDISSPPERTEELVERAARAIAGNHGYDFDATGEDALPEAERNAWRDDARAALQSLGYAEMEKENTATITEWATTTFGDTGGHPRRAARANEEMAELLRAVVSGEDDDRLAEEAADVAIVLHLFAGRLGRDLTAEIDKKMKRNRARKWAVDATGCGYHVQEAAE